MVGFELEIYSTTFYCCKLIELMQSYLKLSNLFFEFCIYSDDAQIKGDYDIFFKILVGPVAYHYDLFHICFGRPFCNDFF